MKRDDSRESLLARDNLWPDQGGHLVLSIRFALIVGLIAALSACSSVGYVGSEFAGSVKPEGGTKEVIPATRAFSGSPDAIRTAVLAVLQDQGYFYEENRSGGTIKTEAKPLPNFGGMAGASFTSRAFINLEGQNVTYRVRFDKKSNIVMSETNVEYTEKENELRRDFFAALGRRLPQ